MLGKILFFALLSGARAACSDYYKNFACNYSNPALLKIKETSGYNCEYTEQKKAGQPPEVTHCNLTCENGAVLVAYLSDFGNYVSVKSAHFDSKTWSGKQESGPDFDMGLAVEFGCLENVPMLE